MPICRRTECLAALAAAVAQALATANVAPGEQASFRQSIAWGAELKGTTRP